MGGPELSRRTFVGGVAGAGLVLLADRQPALRALGLTSSVAPSAAASTTIRLVRASDQTDVTIELVSCAINGAGDQIVPSDPGAQLRISFGRQHLAEQPFTAASPTPGAAARTHAAAAASTVVIPVPAAIDATLAGIVTAAASLVVQQTAGVPDGSATSLELPAALVLSPAVGTKLTAEAAGRTVGTVTELWVARLTDAAGGPFGIRAVHNRSNLNLVPNAIPTATDRSNLVANSALALATARRLWLSSHGAFADIRGDWSGASLSRWSQRIVAGRDVHAETVNLGYLAPFGHRAALITIAERQHLVDSGGGVTSAMVRRTYLELAESTKLYPTDGATGQPDQGRGWAFRTIRATLANRAPVTMAAVQEGGTDIPGVSEARVNGVAVSVDYELIDMVGNEALSTSFPAWFITDAFAHRVAPAAAPGRMVAAFNARTDRNLDLGGAKVAFADEAVVGSGATTKETERLTIQLERSQGVTQAELAAALQPAFYPRIEAATIVDPALGDGGPVDVTLHPRLLDFGTTALATGNFDGAVLRLASARSAEVATGSPARAVAGIDLTAEVLGQYGPGLDLPSSTAGWDPADALGAASQVLGNIPLEQILAVVDLGSAVRGVDLPATVVSVEGDDVIVVTSFAPSLDSQVPEVTGFLTTPDSRAEVTVTSTFSLDEGVGSQVVDIALFDFELEIPPSIPVVILEVAQLRVVQPADGSIEVFAKIVGWHFAGDVRWLEPVGGFLTRVGGSLTVEVADGRLLVEGRIGLPLISLGVVTIRNVNLFGGLELPFDDAPTVLTAGLGSAAKPVEATTMGFEGKFYLTVMVECGSSPLTTVIAHVKISAQLFGFDLVVVKATISLLVTATFEQVGSEIAFRGSIGIEGEIDFFGLVNVAVGLVATLTYASATEELVLRGKITYRVDSFLGGESGSVPIGRTTIELGNGSAGPQATGPATFRDRYSTDSWTAYTLAFAG